MQYPWCKKTNLFLSFLWKYMYSIIIRWDTVDHKLSCIFSPTGHFHGNWRYTAQFYTPSTVRISVITNQLSLLLMHSTDKLHWFVVLNTDTNNGRWVHMCHVTSFTVKMPIGCNLVVIVLNDQNDFYYGKINW